MELLRTVFPIFVSDPLAAFFVVSKVRIGDHAELFEVSLYCGNLTDVVPLFILIIRQLPIDIQLKLGSREEGKKETEKEKLSHMS